MTSDAPLERNVQTKMTARPSQVIFFIASLQATVGFSLSLGLSCFCLKILLAGIR
jgi:hypothetical protein